MHGLPGDTLYDSCFFHVSSGQRRTKCWNNVIGTKNKEGTDDNRKEPNPLDLVERRHEAGDDQCQREHDRRNIPGEGSDDPIANILCLGEIDN